MRWQGKRYLCASAATGLPLQSLRTQRPCAGARGGTGTGRAAWPCQLGLLIGGPKSGAVLGLMPSSWPCCSVLPGPVLPPTPGTEP